MCSNDANSATTPALQDENVLKNFQKKFHDAKTDLFTYVQKLCPGEHIVTQRRDKNPAWCSSCGRDAYGNMVRP